MNDKILFETTTDTGDVTPDSISPIADGEDAVAAVFGRPDEIMRKRGEVLRREVQNLKYLANADRAALVGVSGGALSWVGGALVLAPETALHIRPFLTPAAPTPARLVMAGLVLASRTAVFVEEALPRNPLRAYGKYLETIYGANDYSLEIIDNQNTTEISLEFANPNDKRNFVLIVRSGYHTNQNILDFFTADPGAAEFRILGFTLALAQETAPNAFFPALTDEQRARTYFAGAADPELHTVNPAALAAFFAEPENLMAEGDTLCVRYDALVMESGGGRRQSMAVAPEDNAALTEASLFLPKNAPELLDNALPIATVFNGNLVLANGFVLREGDEVNFPQNAFSVYRTTATGRFQAGDNAVLGVETKDAALVGQLELSRDGADPQYLDHARLKRLTDRGDANALHTHTAILRRLLLGEAAFEVLAAQEVPIASLPFATSQDGQIVALQFSLATEIGANTALRWEVFLDGVSTGQFEDTGEIVWDVGDGDPPTPQLNGDVWVVVPNAGDHVIELRLTSSLSPATVNTSRITLS